MHAKTCAGTEKLEWSGQILMGLLSHAKQVLGTLKTQLVCKGRMGDGGSRGEWDG